jgi:hypothetical protein
LLAAERQPNIVVLLANDLSYADVWFPGGRDPTTPNIAFGDFSGCGIVGNSAALYKSETISGTTEFEPRP